MDNLNRKILVLDEERWKLWVEYKCFDSKTPRDLRHMAAILLAAAGALEKHPRIVGSLMEDLPIVWGRAA